MFGETIVLMPSHTEPLKLGWDRDNGHPCFHPEHEEDLALHETLTRIDEWELDRLRADWERSVSPCFHPEQEGDLALHETLTRIDERELDRLRAGSPGRGLV
jgi:hypothetical protein